MVQTHSLPDGILRPLTAVIQVRGEDCFAFLQSQGTADLRCCRDGSSVHGLWLDHKGLIHGDARIWQAGEGEWWLISEATEAKALIERLERHIIADDVELVDATAEWRLLTLSRWPTELPPMESADLVRRMEEGIWVLRPSAVLPGGGTDFLLAPEAARQIAWCPVDGAEIERVRVCAGVPLVGKDLQPGRWNPFEAGLMSAVSLQKGCFLGQEVVARAHRLGRRSARWVSLVSSSGEALLEAPFPLLQEGIPVGECTSIVRVGDDQVCALAWLKSRIPDGEWRSDTGRVWQVRSLGEP